MQQFGGVRGMVAVEQLAAGEELASVPFDQALVVQPSRRCPVPELCDDAHWKRSPWFVKLALLLLHERRRGAAARVSQYVADLLAIDIETPVVWADEELAQLHYPPLERKIREQRREWRELYSALAAAAPSGGAPVSEADFLWALQAVRSRAFSGPYAGPRLRSRAALAALLLAAGLWSYFGARLPLESVLNAGISALLFNILYDYILSTKFKWYALLPVIDYCNHASHVKSTVAFEYFGERFTACVEEGVPQGEQVLINYGPDSNDYLLQYYGFTEAGNPHDSYALAVAAEAGKQAPEQLVLTTGGLAPATEACFRERGQAPAAYKALAAKACKAEKAGWPTTREEDERLLARLGGAKPRLATALRFRIAKKALLESALKALR